MTETLDLLFTGVPDLTNTGPDLAFAGPAFSLSAFQGAEKLPSFSFQTPVTVTIRYTDADVAGLDEGRLRLLYLDGASWVDAACGPYVRNPAANTLRVPICHLSEFGLYQWEFRVFLPLVVRPAI